MDVVEKRDVCCHVHRCFAILYAPAPRRDITISGIPFFDVAGLLFGRAAAAFQSMVPNHRLPWITILDDQATSQIASPPIHLVSLQTSPSDYPLGGNRRGDSKRLFAGGRTNARHGLPLSW